MIGVIIAMLIGFVGIAISLYIVAKDKQPKAN